MDDTRKGWDSDRGAEATGWGMCPYCRSVRFDDDLGLCEGCGHGGVRFVLLVPRDGVVQSWRKKRVDGGWFADHAGP
jgi:hypothetical protein